MFPFYPQQSSTMAAGNLQMFVNVTKRYAGGLQQLAELNVQTVKTVFEEGTSVLKAGGSAKPGEFLTWESTLFAAFPEKAAAYTRHFLSIIRATETDILSETRSHYEQYGINIKGVPESAVGQGQSALQESSEHLLSITAASTDAVKDAAVVVLDAGAEIAQNAIDTSAHAADSVKEVSEAALRPAKAGSKR
ncbi:TIGR01841 family phasin [Caballeronia sp.]|uniref:TIGR01841 family phasin n=1 Tax=Caballeronia sp. TaxID=1931223 RepID=UPI003C4F15C2